MIMAEYPPPSANYAAGSSFCGGAQNMPLPDPLLVQPTEVNASSSNSSYFNPPLESSDMQWHMITELQQQHQQSASDYYFYAENDSGVTPNSFHQQQSQQHQVQYNHHHHLHHLHHQEPVADCYPPIANQATASSSSVTTSGFEHQLLMAPHVLLPPITSSSAAELPPPSHFLPPLSHIRQQRHSTSTAGASSRISSNKQNPEKLGRLEARRKRNREAAQRCRTNRIETIRRLEQKRAELLQDIDSLKRIVTECEQQSKQIDMTILQKHFCRLKSAVTK